MIVLAVGVDADWMIADAIRDIGFPVENFSITALEGFGIHRPCAILNASLRDQFLEPRAHPFHGFTRLWTK